MDNKDEPTANVDNRTAVAWMTDTPYGRTFSASEEFYSRFPDFPRTGAASSPPPPVALPDPDSPHWDDCARELDAAGDRGLLPPVAGDSSELFGAIRRAVEESSPRWGDAHDNPNLHKLTVREREWIAGRVLSAVAGCLSAPVAGDVEALVIVGPHWCGHEPDACGCEEFALKIGGETLTTSRSREKLEDLARRLTPSRSDAPDGGGVAMPEPAYPACKHLTFCEGAEEPLYTADQLRTYGDARAAAALARLVPVAEYIGRDAWDRAVIHWREHEHPLGTQLYTLSAGNGTDKGGGDAAG